MIINDFFKNKFSKNENIFVLDKEDKYTENFSHQWKDFNLVQIDSHNKTTISKDYINDLMFNNLDYLKDKNVLEIGCGAGRFTEHLVNFAKFCVSVDLSRSIFYNVAKDSDNLLLIKSDFLKLISNKKFDIVICRGVLQHTPRPTHSIIKLFEFVKNDGRVYFDYYKKPKLGRFHPKYFFWRPFISKFFTYSSFKSFLEKNISNLIFFKKIIRKIFLNSNFVADCIIPIWDFREDQYKINNNLYKKWTILDTLDGIFAKFDFPKSNNEILNILKSNNFKIINNNKKRNFIEAKLN